MGLGVKRKHSASELNLDALFADLDSSVTKATRPRAIPKKSAPVPPQHKKLGEAWNSDNTKKKSAERERELLALCDGLSDGLPTTPAKPTRRAPSRHATPLRKREQHPTCQAATNGLSETDLNALIDGLDWDEFDKAPTPVSSLRKNPMTPRSAKRHRALANDASPSIRRKITSSPSRSHVPPPTSNNTLLNSGIDCFGYGDNEPPEEVTVSDPKHSRKFTSTSDPASPNMLKPDQVRDRTTRCIVRSVAIFNEHRRQEKKLHLIVDDGSKAQRLAVLKDDWANTDVRVNDVVNLIGSWEISGEEASPIMVLSTSRNILILHPDLLIPATSISAGSKCVRRPLLSALVRSSSADVTPSVVWGQMLHEVMQSCLSSGTWSESFISEKIDEQIRSSFDRLVQIRVGFDVARSELLKRAKGLATFGSLYVNPTPKTGAQLTDASSKLKTQARLSISGLKEVEETIWSPSYGMKGVVDATVECRITQNSGLVHQDQQWILPLEIKTGRATSMSEHRAQTILYTLLLSERYGVEVPAGLLYYTQSEEVIRVPVLRNELRGLLILRNEIAAHTIYREEVEADPPQQHTSDSRRATAMKASKRMQLPPSIDDQWACSKCYKIDACMLYRNMFDENEPETSSIAELYESRTSHLTTRHAEFFRYWDSLISLEERELDRFHNELWTMTAEAREKYGRCYANMTIVHYEMAQRDATSSRSESRRHLYTLKRWRDGNGEKSASLLGTLSKGDAVNVSIEPNLLALGRGFVAEIAHDKIVVGIDRLMTVDAINRGRPSGAARFHDLSHAVFRIDKDELATGMTRIRDNMAQVFYQKSDSRLRSLIVDLAPPSFRVAPPKERDMLPPGLSSSQKDAVMKVLTAQDYALVLGMPGTGKTTTIAEIIKILVSRGSRILLTSYTHSAVDTILRKLTDSDVRILRLGQEDKIHPEVRRYSLNALPTANSLEMLEDQLLIPPVVATTCLSVDHAIFSRRKFDVCIVDEASQITLPTCLGPLRFADRFVLVGDHHQLPPLVRSHDARKGGLDESLFKRLCNTHPEAVVDLKSQYRMNEDIMLVANELVYSNKLSCGTPEVAARSLVIPDPTGMKSIHNSVAPRCEGKCWLEDALDPTRKVVFLDTDDTPAKESRVGDLVQNETEVIIVQQIAKALLRCGIVESQIGIISLYRQQNKLLTQALSTYPGIEVLTADRSQGRDKDCIIVSMTRSNDRGDIGELLKDSRRINVILTRARSKLIIVGSRTTLAGTAAPPGGADEVLLPKLMRVLSTNKWMMTLPPEAHTLHQFASPPKSAAQLPEDSCEVESTSKKGHIGSNIFKSRSMLRDIANDI